MASKAADISPPAAVSATEIVSLRALSKLATSSTMALRGSGGNRLAISNDFEGGVSYWGIEDEMPQADLMLYLTKLTHSSGHLMK
jgi:hypothetical protein